MVKIYIVRHCEALGNLKKSFQGRTDTDISEDGKKQLEYLKERFKDITIDKVYSSPLIRAYKTALAATDGKGVEVIKDDRFSELDVGIIEGMAIEDIAKEHPWFFDVWDNSPETFTVENGESMTALYDRMWDGIREIAEDPDNNEKNVLVASHGCAIRNLICRILHNDIKMLCYTPWSVNTAVSLLVFDENGVRAEFINDSSHLPDCLIKVGRLLSLKKGENE